LHSRKESKLFVSAHFVFFANLVSHRITSIDIGCSAIFLNTIKEQIIRYAWPTLILLASRFFYTTNIEEFIKRVG